MIPDLRNSEHDYEHQCGPGIFERMDQIDFTGPFEVLSRMPDTTIQVIAK
jgi:cyclohexyl-isocyanide hydratase